MSGHVIALCGGVGGAKLAFGLTRILRPDELTIVVNTGDDFVHLGLHVSPDIDTVIYTLAGLADRERGWGLAGETWQFMDQLKRLGGEGWFNLGDRDLAMHVERTRRLSAGETLSAATRALANALSVRHAIVPMSDDPVRTVVQTDEGELAFQRYFVGRQCQPVVTGVRFDGAAASRPAPGLAAALARRDVDAVIVCPSNPYLSIDPILSIPGVRDGLTNLQAPIVAVSPIVGGRALKGPAAKLMHELGVVPGPMAIVDHYRGLLAGLVVDEEDRAEGEALDTLGLPTLATASVMNSDADRVRLAVETLAFTRSLPHRFQRRAS
ncbi:MULTISPECIES: 2-phospho-L-lactate transferase [unclassified Phenylobacterium]|uniref:2-phospho-L-lactate transferase n=1 Tax=unclassified Phenylobacterium TaxID=2640670 RepID=UPI00083B8F7D|nr:MULTISPECIES: 2-phospho-L-lactate transferase [unclassified Phenylobacterium]